MKALNYLLATLALGSSVAMADCVKPDAPSLPDGASASMDDMLAGQKSVKTFQEANLEYMGCLEKTFTAAKSRIESGKVSDAETAEELKSNYEKAVDDYNAAVSREETVAGQFNTEIREYKAANPD
ncbi:hypothetical protein [Kineobactrum salinum]|uniref:Uncharacterized protein n=1 Tax=Kineobactrum salinum TaxID=2708301 RepID=A0A6C0U1C0_9GAMM|nr:hypothetical protein [Kineobactrum salinum]QIB65583.1 hypothetical protein G3T16_09365 [Kineobactrum salinum]